MHRLVLTLSALAALTPAVGHASSPAAWVEFTTDVRAKCLTAAQAQGIARLESGLRLATYNYMLGLGFDRPVEQWFNRRTPNNKKRKKR